jgi:dihydroflavonol-4-reductase
MKILVTGASGFIGSYIVEEALRQGMETWAAVRPTSSRKYLQDERIHFINLNLSSEEELEKELAPHEFDYIVHAAGATKCLHAEDFYKKKLNKSQERPPKVWRSSLKTLYLHL